MKSEKLNEWFDRSARRPMVAATLMVLAICACFIFGYARNSYQAQVKGSQQVADMVGLALTQKNRILIESVLDATHWQFDSQATSLSDHHQTILSSRYGNKTSSATAAPWFYREVQAPIPGSADLSIHMIVPIFPGAAAFMVMLSLVVGLLGFFFVLVSKIQYRLKAAILDPLEKGLAQDDPMPIEELERLRLLQKEVTENKITLAVSDAVLKRNLQIAHDVRSPLAALQSALEDTKHLEEQTRVQIRTAVTRIKDIANGLLAKNINEKKVEKESSITGFSTEPQSSELLSALLESTVSQKRLQYRDLKTVGITCEIEERSACLFADIQPTEFHRILSNTINNAVEALESGGHVDVVLTSSAERRALIQIKDNGKGIPSDLLSRVLERGGTFGKVDGNGLGLSHAKETVEAWGGIFKLNSIKGMGTTVTLELPIMDPPMWFAPVITASPKTIVIVADDDPSVHQLWDQRLKEIVPTENLVHLYTPPEVLDWYRENLLTEDVLYLVDYEFANHKETGLDLIDKVGISAQAILVTSHCDEIDIRTRCEKLGLKMIPKVLAARIPMECAEKI
jgi:signal transduction histidine kinase